MKSMKGTPRNKKILIVILVALLLCAIAAFGVYGLYCRRYGWLCGLKAP